MAHTVRTAARVELTPRAAAMVTLAECVPTRAGPAFEVRVALGRREEHVRGAGDLPGAGMDHDPRGGGGGGGGGGRGGRGDRRGGRSRSRDGPPPPPVAEQRVADRLAVIRVLNLAQHRCRQAGHAGLGRLAVEGGQSEQLEQPAGRGRRRRWHQRPAGHQRLVHRGRRRPGTSHRRRRGAQRGRPLQVPHEWQLVQLGRVAEQVLQVQRQRRSRRARRRWHGSCRRRRHRRDRYCSRV